MEHIPYHTKLIPPDQPEMTVHIQVTFQYKCTLNKGENTYFLFLCYHSFTNSIILNVLQSIPAIHSILESDAY